VMSRIRTVKPGYYTDGTLGRLGHITRDFYRSSWTFFCDQAHHPLDPQELSVKVYPYDSDMNHKRVADMIFRLAIAGRYTVYEHGGKHWLYITNWHHQRIDKPTTCRCPAPKDGTVITDPFKIKAAINQAMGATFPTPTAKEIPENKRPDRKTAARVLEYLNDQCKRNFSIDSPTNQGVIIHLIKVGHKEKDFMSVIDFKKKEFGSRKEMRGYLRPSTLFKKDKFPTYLEQAKEDLTRPTAADEAEALLDE